MSARYRLHITLLFFLCCPMLHAQTENTNVIAGLKILMALGCSSFMALSAISFLRFRLKKKQREYQDLLKLFRIEEHHYGRTVEDEYSVSDYILPVVFATIICLFFWTIIFMGLAWEEKMHTTGAILIVGLGEEFVRPALLATTYAFLGGFLWSAQNITRRLLSADLSPGIYYATGLRILYASMVSLILATIMHNSPLADQESGLLPATAFLTGMLPDQALRYIKERVRIFSNKGDFHILELENIDGINLFHKTRLGEIGIDNAQNLAEANLIEVVLKTPFAPRQILDWIVQAKLYVSVEESYQKLRQVGIRTVFDLYRLEEPQERIKEIATETKLTELFLRNVLRRVSEDSDVAALWKIQNRLTIGVED